jgi:phosphoglycolate phosphatase-like HAD superfamily hydrolase
MVGVESPLVAEGLLQHPETAELFSARLGPAYLAVAKENLPKLRAALEQLGIDLVIADDVDLVTE